ncbi:glucokinase [Thalassotalea sp. LPB0316]|uniref:glucokinase n=1 Tax=Thalassotalea sp. LPB0316 TaxID=2769490 RepID=UPI001865DCD7|nr:glucokinase [Thalassotalea sp. LPB0316]QOL24856.1 glucokinase [Thalassotalea sp. LPB0316]
MAKQITNLVADIGGTNIRIGQVLDNREIVNIDVFQCRDFPSLADVFTHYLTRNELAQSQLNVCLAIACPAEQDLVVMTNMPWQFSKSELKATLNLNHLLVINDYTAIAHAVPFLTDDQKVQIGRGEALANRPISICGPGTGLGVANVVPSENGWVSLGGEGGHVDFAPIDEAEMAILRFLMKKYAHVSYEQLLSGLGIEQIYQALADYQGVEAKPLAAHEISAAALDNTDDLCHQTLEQFCKILGSFAGNLALTLSSFSGVYIAGGIVPRFIEFLKQSEFRARFEEKGRLSPFNQNIPTYVITEAQPGLLGACAYLCQQLKEDLSRD